jgi:hypothetical protein
MAPNTPLPLSEDFTDANEYVDSLLEFAASSTLFQTLCGGVHILDFFTREQSIYETVLPLEWREWFQHCDTMDLLNLLMRHDLQNDFSIPGAGTPPATLLAYIKAIRKHFLGRKFTPRKLKQEKLPHHVAVGMIPKKIHEVVNFASYVDGLAEDVSIRTGKPVTHFVDFGSGQNYLGRSLASPPYNKHIIAVESRELNINGAKRMDVVARVAEREKVMRNKKSYRQHLENQKLPKKDGVEAPLKTAEATKPLDRPSPENAGDFRPISDLATIYTPGDGKNSGSIQYIEYRVENGDLSPVVAQVTDIEAAQSVSELEMAEEDAEGEACTDCKKAKKVTPPSEDNLKVISKVSPKELRMMAVSIHSCGNLSHHGIKALLVNPTVCSIAIVGCCYNLLTERLGPPTYKLPNLRPNLRPINARVKRESEACDPHGFPMSNRVATYGGDGIRFNITARMMAVQAPQNWTEKESDSFFTRHYFRALLQKVFLDHGVVAKTQSPTEREPGSEGGKEGGDLSNDGTDPVIIGSLRKSCYSSFLSYVRGAVAKIMTNSEPDRAAFIEEKMSKVSDEEIQDYVNKYESRKKELSIMWSLMAFSAGVVESLIVVDRWLFLKEHSDVVQDAWVEVVFDYQQSPRNLVVVGIKR